MIQPVFCIAMNNREVTQPLCAFRAFTLSGNKIPHTTKKKEKMASCSLKAFSGTTGLWLGRAGPQTPACSGGPEDRPAQPLAMLSLSPAQARLHATRVLTRRPLGRCLSTCSFSPWRSHSAQLGLDTTTSRKPPWHLPSCPGPGEVSSELTQAAPPRLQGLVPLFVSKQ